MDEGRLPNLKSILEAKGSLVKLETIGRTGTLCSYTHVFTGLMYEQTGVIGNYNIETHYKGVLEKDYNEKTRTFEGLNFFLRPIPYSHTIIQAIKDQGNKIGWFVSSGMLGKDPLKSALSEIGKNADSYSLAAPWQQSEGDNYIWTLTDKTIDFMKKNNSKGYLASSCTSPVVTSMVISWGKILLVMRKKSSELILRLEKSWRTEVSIPRSLSSQTTGLRRTVPGTRMLRMFGW